mmetsp:Transcript_21826/g.19887  ORF Transcript_21826/g.19887 Transcript_21826/m.19887 type:complete len:222 (-) Transcript_21826:101-766(-)
MIKSKFKDFLVLISLIDAVYCRSYITTAMVSTPAYPRDSDKNFESNVKVYILVFGLLAALSVIFITFLILWNNKKVLQHSKFNLFEDADEENVQFNDNINNNRADNFDNDLQPNTVSTDTKSIQCDLGEFITSKEDEFRENISNANVDLKVKPKKSKRKVLPNQETIHDSYSKIKKTFAKPIFLDNATVVPMSDSVDISASKNKDKNENDSEEKASECKQS